MAMNNLSIFSLLLSLVLSSSYLVDGDGRKPLPVVLWHGMGDNCCHSFSMGWFEQFLKKQLPGLYVRSLMVGNSPTQDTENGFFMSVPKQIAMVCDKIKNDSNLTERGYNAIGFSQGGQFIRAIAQTCPQGMRTLISLGGQHQGVYGLPKCLGENHVICDYARRLLNYGAYVGWIQRLLVQAQYWHDPLDEATYREKSIFIADINNAKAVKNPEYKKNLLKLKKLVLVKFNQDSVVDPRGTEWFGFYYPGQAQRMAPYNATDLYKEDWIGLKELNERGRVDFISTDGDHLQLTEEFLTDVIIKKYLG